MRWLFLLLLAGLTAAQLYLGARRGWDLRGEILAKEDMRRLTNVALRLFSGKIPPEGEAFWMEVGRKDPLRDPWRNPYRFEKVSGGGAPFYQWRSAGPDGTYASGDDLTHPVPFGEEISREENVSTQSSAMDAR